jgi:hypothetical protein
MEMQRDSKTEKKNISGAGLSGGEPTPSTGAKAQCLLPASGLYAWKRSMEELLPGSSISAERMELRLDVDRHTPLMTASGTVWKSISTKLHWIARLTQNGQDRWKGMIWWRDGETEFFPYDDVEIQVVRGASSSQLGAMVTFSNNRGLSHELTFEFNSPYFHPINFEFDYLKGEKEKVTTEIDTWAHPNRPANLPRETLTIKTVFERAGFSMSVSPGGGEVPISLAGANAVWNDAELHDAMQKYWFLYAPEAQWALWLFFASLYEDPKTGNADANTYGIMFDNIGKQQRQGTAIFNDSAISIPRYGDRDSEAGVKRKRFFYGCHEMGHCFNLPHSFNKEHPTKIPWNYLKDEPEARSFMNYPHKVKDGEPAFFADFEYRFSDSELLFIRHAPSSFVEMGNAEWWFDSHGFEEALVSPEPSFRLELRVNRNEAIFEFMEPVTLELKLTNISLKPLMVEKHLLSMTDSMTVIIKRDGRAARQFIPFARYDRDSPREILNHGRSLYESLFVSAGNNGWDLAEPGDYCVRVALHYDGEYFLSNKLKIHVLPPKSVEEEKIAKDFFSDEVGRVIFFHGSCFLEKANDILRDVAARLDKQKVAMHASVVLGSALSRDFKQLVIEDQKPGPRFSIKIREAKPEEAKKLLTPALIDKSAMAAESLGHIDYRWYAKRFVDYLAREGAKKEAAASHKALSKTLSERRVRGRPILPEVLEEIEKSLPDIESK